MKKTFALVLALFVLATSICVFAPNETASAAVSFSWVPGSAIYRIRLSDSTKTSHVVSIDMPDFLEISSSGVTYTFFPLKSIYDKFIAQYSAFDGHAILTFESNGTSIFLHMNISWLSCQSLNSNLSFGAVSYGYLYDTAVTGGTTITSSFSGFTTSTTPFSFNSLEFKNSFSDNHYILSGYRLRFEAYSSSMPLNLSDTWVAFAISNAEPAPYASAVGAFYEYWSKRTVDTSSESYLTGYEQGKKDAAGFLDAALLSTQTDVENVSVVALDSSGNSVSGTHFDIDWNYLYNDEKYLRIYNISAGGTIDHYLVTLYFSNKQSFVPLSVRSTTGFVSSGNNTAPFTPVSYLGNGMYGSDFGSLGSATSFNVYLNSNQTSVTLRLMGNSYGNTLQDVYQSGLNDGLVKGEKIGYDKGKADGIVASGKYTFFNLISSIVDVPLNAFLSLFNLEIFGVNLAPLMTALLSICLVITIIKLIL